MGEVYRAQDTRLGRTVALKRLPAEVTHDAELKRRLETEARAASALNHPNVATVYDFIEDGGESFIVFEYVEGKTLREQSSGRRMRTAEILDIGVQIADALEAAHKRGIVHRDLKPENILLASDAQGAPRVKVLDFGLAKILKPLKPVDAAAAGSNAETAPLVTAPGVIVGTVNYMSPEQVMGEAADARADIYSLGLVLYELAAGSNPFAGKTPASTMANILKDDAPPVNESNTTAAVELDRIVRKCLRKRREERYQRARELLVDLTNLRHDSAAGPPAAGSRTGSGRYVAAAGSTVFARGPARGIFAAIQIGYLAIYGAALANSDDAMQGAMSLVPAEQLSNWKMPGLGLPLLLACALAGVAVRLYLISAIAADYPDLGVKYRRLFPPVFVLDVIWALSPLLLHRQLKVGLALAAVAGLAYLPFVQRRLLYDAYSPYGGRTSAIQVREPEA